MDFVHYSYSQNPSTIYHVYDTLHITYYNGNKLN